MVNALAAYRPLVVFDRLSKLSTTDKSGENIDQKIAEQLSIVKMPNDHRLHGSECLVSFCEKDCHNTHDIDKGDYYICLKDILSDEYFDGDNHNNCLLGYIKYLRYYTEKLFNDLIKIVDTTCTEVKRNQPRNPTGNTVVKLVK